LTPEEIKVLQALFNNTFKRRGDAYAQVVVFNFVRANLKEQHRC
jgi:hypothetical protein